MGPSSRAVRRRQLGPSLVPAVGPDGVFERIWAALVEECDDLGAVGWKWQAADGMLGKARFGGKKTGKNPTDRGKKGTKKSVLVEGDGGPLGGGDRRGQRARPQAAG